MHELALVESVIDAIVERVGERRVTRVRLRVGALAAVEPEAMRFCFDVCAQSTQLEGATLELERVPARGHCRACDQEFDVEDALSTCACGSMDVAISGGDELLIRDVEVG